jgi:hypothetical protein
MSGGDQSGGDGRKTGRPVCARGPASNGLAAVLVLCGLLSSVLTGAGASSMEVKGLVVPFYLSGDSAAAAVLKIGHISRDHHKVGFFRVKLWPMVVADHVRFEALRAGAAGLLWTNWLSSQQSWVGGRDLEVRHFQLWFAGESTPRLEADRLSPTTKSGSRFTLENVTLRSQGGQVSFARARGRLLAGTGWVELEGSAATARYNLATGECQVAPQRETAATVPPPRL